MNKNRTGTLTKEELENMTHWSVKNAGNIDWDKIIAELDQTGNGTIDFQEFISACINRKRLNDEEEVKKAFMILDNDNDGKISVQDFNDIFCSYGGARMNSEIWSELLKEADRGGDGFISENEFADAMHMVMRNSLKTKKRDQRMRHTVKPPSDL